MQSPGERLKSLIKSKYGSVVEFAKIIGVSQPLLSAYLTGRAGMGLKFQERLRSAGIDVEYILTGRTTPAKSGWDAVDNPPPISPVAPIDPDLRIPLFLSPAKAGYPSPYVDDTAVQMNPSQYYNKRTFMVQAKGDSMTGARIHDGDWLLVHADIEPKHGDIVVARVGSGVVVKRFHKNGQAVLLHPDNKRYKPIPLGPDVEVLGVVMKIEVLLR